VSEHTNSPDENTSNGSRVAGIEIDVETLYVESESEPDENKFVFAYTVTIRNVGHTAAKLLTRHWVIRDAVWVQWVAPTSW